MEQAKLKSTQGKETDFLNLQGKIKDLLDLQEKIQEKKTQKDTEKNPHKVISLEMQIAETARNITELRADMAKDLEVINQYFNIDMPTSFHRKMFVYIKDIRQLDCEDDHLSNTWNNMKKLLGNYSIDTSS
jgi:hypothetical protein